MKRNIRLLSLILALCICTVIPVSAAEETVYTTDMGFDDLDTNGTVPGVSVDGTENSRVIEYKTKNKGYFIPTDYRDNTVIIPLEKEAAEDKYIVSFDVKYEVAPSEFHIYLRDSKGSAVEFISVDEKQNAYNKSSKYIGGISKSKMKNVAIAIDKERGSYSIYIDGNLTSDKWILSSLISAQSLQIITSKNRTEGSGILIDNLRCYSGTEYKNEKRRYSYNDMVLAFEPVDESIVPNNVYFKKDMNDPKNIGMTIQQKLNSIYGVYDEAEQNGYVKFDIQSTNDCYIETAVSATSKNLVLECDVKYDGPLFGCALFFLRDTESSSATEQTTLARVQSNGTVTSGGSSAPLIKKKWNRVSAVIDLGKHKYSTYVNGVLIAKDKAMPEAFKKLSLWRVYVEGNNIEGSSLMLDNFRLYDGTEPRDIESEEETVMSVMTTNVKGEKYLKGRTALNGYSSKIYYGNQKMDMDIPAINELNEMLVSVDTIEKVFGEKVSVNNNKITIGSNVTMNIGENVMYVDKKPVDIIAAPRYENGYLYIPSVAYAEKGYTSKNVIHDNYGMILVSADEIDTAMLQQCRMYLYFDRDNVETLTEKFDKATNGGTMHPRIMLTQADFDRIREEVKTSPTKKKWFESILADADHYLTTEPDPYEIINSRLLHVGQDNHDEITDLAMAYQITGDEKYAERVYRELEALASYPDWHPQHFLDTGSISQSAAMGFDWIYHYMTPEQRDKIAKGFIKNGLDPFWLAYTGRSDCNVFWLTSDTNWNSEVNGGAATLAFALAEYDKEWCMTIVENAFRGMEYMWDAMAPDGAWFEGPGYWAGTVAGAYGVSATADVCLGEPFEFNFYKGVYNMALFPIYFSDPKGYANNFHDVSGTLYGQRSPFQLYIAKVYGDKNLGVLARDLMEQYNKKPTAFDLMFYDVACDDLTGEIEFDLDKRFVDAEFIAMRENWGDENGMWFSTNAGELTNPHDHVDNGTFVMTLGGVRWAIDLGNDSLYYVTAKDNPAVLAGYDSLYYYRRKGEGHNIVIINPDKELEMDKTTKSAFAYPVSGENAVYTTVDLTDHYNKNVTSYLKGYMLSDGRRSVTIRDEIELKNESKLYWFMHTNGNIVIEDNNNALIVLEGKVLKVQLMTDAKESELTVMDPVSLPTSPQFTNTANPGVTKLAYKLKADGKVNITVKMSLLQEAPSNVKPSDTPISQWTVDGAQPYEYAYSNAKLKNICLNGKPLYGFKPEMYDYSNVLNEKGEIANITWDSDYKTELHTYDMQGGEKLAEIRVYDTNGAYTSYVIKFRNFVASDYSAYDRHQVKAVEASAEQDTTDPPNLKENSFDGDFSTRWSADGDGHWMVHDFGETVDIDAFAAAFWNGGNRKYTYEVLVSDDNVNFKKVAEYTTTGTSENMETVILKERVRARYVKFLGHGNTANAWNNVLEFATLKKK